MVCRNSEVLARRGCVTLYQPRAPQHYFTDPDVGEWHLHWCHFHPRPHWREWLNWEEPTKGFRTLLLHDDELIRNIGTALGDAMHLSRQRIQGCTDLALNALERAILLIHSANLHPELDARIRKALQLLAEKMRDPFSLPELAKGCGLSVSRLAHLFREQLGESPQKYQEQLRLLSAAHLLRSTGLTITEVACELGYSSPFYFTRRFIKYFQESPSSYRCRRLSGEPLRLLETMTPSKMLHHKQRHS